MRTLSLLRHHFDQPMHVDMILPSLETGGMEAVVARLGRRLRARDLNVSFTVTDAEGEFAEELRADGYRVTLVPQPRRFSSFRTSALEEHYQSVLPDIVHVHSGVWLRAAKAVRRMPHCGVLHTIHGVFAQEPWYGNTVKRLAMRNTDEVVAVSGTLADFLVSEIGVDRSLITVLPNGVDTSVFKPTARNGSLRREFGIPPHVVVIGTVARLDAIKNQSLLISAFVQLNKTHPDAHLLLIGDGPERGRLESQASASDAAPKIHFAGRRQIDSVLYRDLDIFTLPSVLEGTSMCILEAMACGLPIVATAVGGTTAILEASPLPCLVPSGDVEALTAALLHFVNSESDRLSLGGWLRARVESHYSEAYMVDTYLDVYRRIADKRATGASR